jgi:drug/metabolite transporter (DMT)-like permease
MALATRALVASPRIPRLGILLIVMIAFGWGMNWPAMKIALEEIPPWTFRVLCIAIAASLLLAITRVNGERVAIAPRQIPALLLVALFSVVGWQMFSAFGLLYIGSGRAAIIAFTMPIWATALSIIFLGERLRLRQIAALALGMTGLGLLMSDEVAAVGNAPLGGGLMVAAALSWAIGTILVKKLDWGGIPVTAFSGWQLLVGGLPLLIGWALLEPWPDFSAWSLEAWLGMLFASVVGMVFCVTGYFKLLTLVSASVAATGTVAVPVVGVVSSALILGEPIGLPEIAALLLVLGALVLLLWQRR